MRRDAHSFVSRQGPLAGIQQIIAGVSVRSMTRNRATRFSVMPCLDFLGNRGEEFGCASHTFDTHTRARRPNHAGGVGTGSQILDGAWIGQSGRRHSATNAPWAWAAGVHVDPDSRASFFSRWMGSRPQPLCECRPETRNMVHNMATVMLEEALPFITFTSE